MRVVDKRGVYCSLVLLALISFLFWTQSRLPALDEKAQMGQRNDISALAFDVIYPLSVDQSHIQRVFNSSVNWAYTNWQGMSFGFLLAAAVLTLFSYLSFRLNPRGNRFKHAAIGALFGTPLGVCANCSTPIAFGLYRSGLPASSALAVLSSSPSFNVIVLMMSFSLLPFELVLTKSFFVLAFILLVIPLLTKRFPSSPTGEDFQSSFCSVSQQITWSKFIGEFFRRYGRYLFFILKSTLPLMLLAGVMAAFVVEFVSLDFLSGELSYLVLFFVALCAAFFPVPIAFDVVISVALLAAGVDVAYVGAIFFALGVFSIYPAMMIARDLSFRLSVSLFITVVMLAMIYGGLIGEYSKRIQLKKAQELSQQIDQLAQDNLLNATNSFEYIPENFSRALMRNAARACHALGEPKQYVCFERFVFEILSDDFSSEACVYLEDAIEYRQICNRTFDYISVVEEAIETNDAGKCDQAVSSEIERCRYDFFFRQSIEQVSLKPCFSLTNDQARQHCLSDSLALNVESYPSMDICQSLGFKDVEHRYFVQCDSGVERVRNELAILQQGDLNLCLDQGSPDEIKSCQFMVINYKLERGAKKTLCENLSDNGLKSACSEFYFYFNSIKNADDMLCYSINQSGLKARCLEDAIQAKLVKQLSQVRYEYLANLNASDSQEQSTPTIERRRSSNNKSSALNFVLEDEITSNLGRKYGLRVFSLEKQDGVSFSSVNKDRLFNQIPASDIGLKSAPSFKATELFEPFSYGRGIAVGDANKDLWPDLAIAYADRVLVYRNQSGNFIENSVLEFGKQLSPMLVSFVDIDGDLQKDLFISFYAGENRIYWNDLGEFDAARYQALKLENSQLVMSAAFQDVDRDGDIDMALGSWFAGDLRHFNPYRSQNYYIENLPLNEGEKNPNMRRILKPHALPGVQGETLSIMFSDIDRDGSSELIVGNDLDAPDVIYSWDNGGFKLIQLNERFPAFSSFNTMSIASGDLNRDKAIDYFSVDMSFSNELGKDYCMQQGIVDQNTCTELIKLDRAVKEGNISICSSVLRGVSKRQCIEAQLVQLAKQARNQEYCEMLSAGVNNNYVIEILCQAASAPLPPKQEFNYSEYPEGLQRNVLSLSSGNVWRESAIRWGVSESHWSWHSKVADLDNDGWKDIYVGNGYMFGDTGRQVQSNVFYSNQKGKGMIQAQSEYGLEDYLNTPSFVTVDFDRDGDLDIISNRVAANHGVFINQSSTPGMYIDLLDEGVDVLGARLTLSPTIQVKKNQTQTSEVTLGGGFLSFDETIAHYGMAEQKSLGLLEIVWPNGDQEYLEYQFEAGRYYQLSIDN